MQKPLCLFVFLSVFLTGPVSQAAAINPTQDLTQRFADTIIKLSDPNTGIPPSDYGHPGYENLAFLYDTAVDAMLLKAAGRQADAEKIIDYFSSRLRIPLDEIQANIDSNHIYGILKLSPTTHTLGFVNAFDRTSMLRQGKGQLEFLTTPGPMAFMVMAMLQVNAQKYLPDALILGNALLAMQAPDGSIRDGDRSAQRTHTEPHADTLDVFYQLFDLTKDIKWKKAADKARDWFIDHVYVPSEDVIYQGVWEHGPHRFFATDGYSWSMAGKMGDELPLDALDGLTQTMLQNSLVRIRVELPGGQRRTIICIDFADAKNPEVIKARGGFHPMGSAEWTGGVILALQKNAVRFWRARQPAKARHFKAMAELLTTELMKMFYQANAMTLAPYATGQAIAVGHGWTTPYFYVKGPKGMQGGSLIGGWGILPLNGINPFIADDHYYSAYQKIEITASDEREALDYAKGLVATRSFEEQTPTQLPSAKGQIVEPGQYNLLAWQAFEAKNYVQAIRWARKVVDEPQWVRLAQEEEKQKAKEIGGIISYPWGKTFPNNDNPLHRAIWKYPLLNEVAAAMWILAAANYEQGNMEETQKWMRRIITEVPHHQISDVVYDARTGKKNLIDGYWNALVSWAYNPGNSARDAAMAKLIREAGIEIVPPLDIVFKAPGPSLPKPLVVRPLRVLEPSNKAHFPGQGKAEFLLDSSNHF